VLDHIQPILEELAAQRHRTGLSQEAVARRAGLTQTYLSKVERAKIDPRLSTLQDIARAQGLEIMLVPSDTVPAVRALLGQGQNPQERPLFSIEPD
jgi:predicted transcriptional regulator